MDIKPLGINVLIKEAPAKETTSGGIYLPDNAEKAELSDGTVVAVGDLVTQVKPGDDVLYQKWGGTPISHLNDNFLLLSVDDIVAIKDGNKDKAKRTKN